MIALGPSIPGTKACLSGDSLSLVFFEAEQSINQSINQPCFNNRRRTGDTDYFFKTFLACRARTLTCSPLSNYKLRRRTGELCSYFKTFLTSRKRTHHCSPFSNLSSMRRTVLRSKVLIKSRSRILKRCPFSDSNLYSNSNPHVKTFPKSRSRTHFIPFVNLRTNKLLFLDPRLDDTRSRGGDTLQLYKIISGSGY